MRHYLFLLIITMTASCTRERNHPGYTYFPDMAYSPAYKTYEDNPVFENGTMRLPADGTIPRGHRPYPYRPQSIEEQERAGRELRNPIRTSPVILAEGKKQYVIFCAVCHGEKGDGNGHLFTSKRFPAKPRNLVNDYLKDWPDGQIFHVITEGSVSGLMAPHKGQISPENRWKIVCYIRELAKKQSLQSQQHPVDDQ